MKLKALGAAFALPVLLFSCNASDKQIEAWVEKNPEKIMNVLMKYQQAQQEADQPKPEMVAQNADALFKRAESPSIGNGKVEIAYFFDFNCGHCARQSETIKSVMAKTDKVKVVYKNLPVLGPTSELAARAALAAHQQNKYREFYEEIFKSRERSPESFKKIASKLKLDVKKWEADLDSEAVVSELNHVRELADKMKVRGTPFLAIAPDKVIPGRVDDLMGLVDSIN